LSLINPLCSACSAFAKIAIAVSMRLKAKLAVKRLFAGHRIEDDFLVAAGKLHQRRDHVFAHARALPVWRHRDVADVRAIFAVRHRAARRQSAAGVIHKALEHAVGEHDLQIGRLLVAQRRNPVQV
jgi:hypothetical protein